MKTERQDKTQMEPVSGEKYFYYYPTSVVVVGVATGDKVNFMPCSWNTGLSYDPFMYGVSIGRERHTHDLLVAADSFSVNFLSYESRELVRSLGRSTGEEMDKTEKFGIEWKMGERAQAPLMDVAYYALECRKTDAVTFGDHTLFIGNVELMHVSKDLADSEIMATDAVSPLLYLGVDHYITSDHASRVCMKDLPFHYKDTKKR